MVLITVVTPGQTNSTKVQNKSVEPVKACGKVSSELLKPPKLKKKNVISCFLDNFNSSHSKTEDRCVQIRAFRNNYTSSG